MKIIAVSDIHLKYTDKAVDKENQELFISFLKKEAVKADLLILNGDIFDLWFVWKKVIIKQYFPLLRILADIKDKGCRIVYISGNHDFWFKDFLTRYIGIEIHKDHFSIYADSKKVFFTHGDIYTTNDFRYKFYRFLIRKKFFMWLFGTLHPDFALDLGLKLSRSSRKKVIPDRLSKQREIGLERFAEKNKQNYDIVVMGHSHNPKILNFENLIYLNSGDWINHYSYVEINNGNPKLKYYNKAK